MEAQWVCGACVWYLSDPWRGGSPVKGVRVVEINPPVGTWSMPCSVCGDTFPGTRHIMTVETITSQNEAGE